MPQWSNQAIEGARKYPDERWVALCSDVELARRLIRYDHHTVWIKGRIALLRTYSWMSVPECEWPAPLPISVSFTYAKGHPPAPQDLQEAVAGLKFGLEGGLGG